MWGQILTFVVTLAIGYATRPKAPVPKAAAFEDFDFPQVDDGTPQIVVFGDCWIDDWTVLALGNFRVEPIKKKGGKK